MTYLNIDEVESAIANLATAYPTLCSLVQLPNATFEGRISHALRISSAPSVPWTPSCCSAGSMPGSGAAARSWLTLLPTS